MCGRVLSATNPAGAMVRMQIQLPEEQVALLKKLARQAVSLFANLKAHPWIQFFPNNLFATSA